VQGGSISNAQALRLRRNRVVDREIFESLGCVPLAVLSLRSSLLSLRSSLLSLRSSLLSLRSSLIALRQF
jgi:hypothetical protein